MFWELKRTVSLRQFFKYECFYQEILYGLVHTPLESSEPAHTQRQSLCLSHAKSMERSECSDSVAIGRALTGDRRVAGLSLIANGVTVLCPGARHYIRCLVLVQPMKTLSRYY